MKGDTFFLEFSIVIYDFTWSICLCLENDLLCKQFSLYDTIDDISWPLREVKLKSHSLSGE